MKVKNSNKKERKINIPTSLLIILVIAAICIGGYLIFRDAGLINKAFTNIKSLYNLLFG